MGKILCDLCLCYISNHPLSISEHNVGKRHLNNSANPGEPKIKYYISDATKNSKFGELKILFPEKTNHLYKLKYPSREIFEEVVNILYDLLLSYDISEEINPATIDLFIAYTIFLHDLDSKYHHLIQEIPKDKFMYLFNILLQEGINAKDEIEKYYKYYTLQNHYEENNINLVQQQIIDNYEEICNTYEKTFMEAKNSFDIHK